MNILLCGNYCAKPVVRSIRIHLLQMNDGRPHPEAADPIITGPTFPYGTEIIEGELQLTSCRLAARVVLLELPRGGSEHLIVWDWRTGGKCMVCFCCLLLPYDNSILLS